MILSARNMSSRSNRSGIRTGCKKTSTLRWFCCLLLSSHICVIRRGGLSRFLNFFHSGLFRVLAIEFKNQVKNHESEDKPPYGVDKIERCRQFTDKKGNNCNQKSIRKLGFHVIYEITCGRHGAQKDRKSTRLNSSHVAISYAVFCLKKN